MGHNLKCTMSKNFETSIKILTRIYHTVMFGKCGSKFNLRHRSLWEMNQCLCQYAWLASNAVKTSNRLKCDCAHLINLNTRVSLCVANSRQGYAVKPRQTTSKDVPIHHIWSIKKNLSINAGLYYIITEIRNRSDLSCNQW